MTEVERRSNPLIEKNKSAIPGVVHRLPSKGKIYGDGVIDPEVENGEVLIQPMRLREELLMKSPDSILQGSAVSETISYCVPQILDPMRLAPEDVDFLLIAIKKISHGASLTFRDVCMKLNEEDVDFTEENVINEMQEGDRTNTETPETKHSEEGSEEEDKSKIENINNMGVNSRICEFQIPLDFFIDNAKDINEEEYEELRTIEYKNFKIVIRPVSFKDFKDLSVMQLRDVNQMTEEEYLNFMKETSNKNLADRIESVDEYTDREMIMEWIDETFSLKDREYLFSKIFEIQNWGVDFEYDLKCSSCGKTKKTTQAHLNPLYFFLTS